MIKDACRDARGTALLDSVVRDVCYACHLLSYLVEQRTREIGVRMALDATSRSIGALVLSQSAGPVGIGPLVGSSLTAALGAALLATPAAEQIGSAVRLFDPIAYAASLLCIVARLDSDADCDAGAS